MMTYWRKMYVPMRIPNKEKRDLRIWGQSCCVMTGDWSLRKYKVSPWIRIKVLTKYGKVQVFQAGRKDWDCLHSLSTHSLHVQVWHEWKSPPLPHIRPPAGRRAEGGVGKSNKSWGKECNGGRVTGEMEEVSGSLDDHATRVLFLKDIMHKLRISEFYK